MDNNNISDTASIDPAVPAGSVNIAAVDRCLGPQLQEENNLMILETRRMEQIQYDLLAAYNAIEQRIRSLHPGCEWEEWKLNELQAHREKRNQIEQLLMQILQSTSSAQQRLGRT